MATELNIGKEVYTRTAAITLFTHTDLDGAGCAVLAGLAYGDCNIYFCNNGADINDTIANFIIRTGGDNEYHKMIIADHGVNASTAGKINNWISDYHVVELYDHHESSKWLAEHYDWAHVDISKCATAILYDNLSIRVRSESTTSLANYVQDVNARDLWTWQDTDNKYSLVHQHMLRSAGISNYVVSMITRFNDGRFPISKYDYECAKKYIDDMYKYLDDNVDNYIAIPVKYFMNNERTVYNVAFTFANKYTSELGHAICTTHSDIDICAIVSTNRGDHGTVELRCIRDDIDLSIIARANHGGGHKKAAGFQLDADFAKTVFGRVSGMISVINLDPIDISNITNR